MEGDASYLPPHEGEKIFQSTPSAWRETDDYYFLLPKRVISIHSLRMEGDKSPVGGWETLIDISIHSLRMEGDNAR